MLSAVVRARIQDFLREHVALDASLVAEALRAAPGMGELLKRVPRLGGGHLRALTRRSPVVQPGTRQNILSFSKGRTA